MIKKNFILEKSRAAIKNPFWLLIASILFFFACDTLVFRSGLYPRLMKGNDIGALYFRLESAKNFKKNQDRKSLLLVGNSQVERGFSGSQFKKISQKSGVDIVRIDAPKTYEQIWYYALKYSDPHHDKFDAILITLPDFKVEPFGGFGQSPSYATATFLAPFIGIRDWREVINSFNDTDQRTQTTRLAILAGHGYAFDVQDFLLHPIQRIAEYKSRAEQASQWNIDPPDVPGNWADLTISGTTVYCPPSFAHFDCIGGVQNAIQPLSPEAAKAGTDFDERYERMWLGKILDLYKDSPTKVFLMQMPRWPMLLPERTPIAGAPDLRDIFANRPNVTFIDDNLFTELETPQYMHDHVHVSTAAQQRFTEIMGTEIEKIMVIGK